MVSTGWCLCEIRPLAPPPMLQRDDERSEAFRISHMRTGVLGGFGGTRLLKESFLSSCPDP